MRTWIIVALTVAGVLFSAGCGRQAEEAPSHTEHRGHTTGREEERSGSGPPESTVTFEGRTVIGELGSYSWSSGGGGLSADAVPTVPPKGEALAGPANSVVVFDFGGSWRLSSVVAEAYPLGGGNEVRSRHGFRYLVPGGGRSALTAKALEIRRQGNRAEITTELPEGEYVVEVSVLTPRGYDASYYFRLALGKDVGAALRTDIQTPESASGSLAKT